ncbi:hypothetical protein QCA50_015259 [Cerrena zonata]|uniref:Uncharacterized protein n=1 Tax=Cerrena zonata TaxID=2478898 RepID=A0AAW0FQH1_9APHY
MSVRQRIPFKFSEDTQEEDQHILDEQEQEELIQKLKEESDVHNAQYLMVLQALIGLSSILQCIYLMKADKEPPIAPLITSELIPPTSVPLPNLWTILNLFYHANLSIHLLPLSNPIRQSLQKIRSSPYILLLPIGYSILYGLSVAPALLSLFSGNSWVDVVWWLATPAMVYFVHSSQRWFAQETEGIQNLEKLRYDAKGA